MKSIRIVKIFKSSMSSMRTLKVNFFSTNIYITIQDDYICLIKNLQVVTRVRLA